MDNIKFLEFVMKYAQIGPIVQIFIIEAIRAYCEAVLKDPLPKNDPKAIVNPVLWYNTAKEVKELFDAKYGKVGTGVHN